MEEVKTKICPKCGEEKPLTEEFWSNYLKDGHRYWHSYCKKCRSKLNSQCNAKSQKWKQYNIVWRANNLELLKTLRTKWIKNNPDVYKLARKKNWQKHRKNLSNLYIKNQLWRIGLLVSDITPELIEIKRQQLILHRLLKQFTKEGLYELSSAEVNGNQRDAGEVQEERGYSGGSAGVCLTC